jgi:hypothetical protein
MKSLIVVWGWVVFYPVLAPVVTLPLLVFLVKILRSISTRINAALILIVACLLLGAVAYANLRFGPTLYFSFLQKNGEEITAKVTDVRKGSNLSGESSTKVDLLYTSPTTGETSVTLPLSANRILPSVESLELSPEIGDTVRIHVFPQAESAMMISSDPEKSTYGAKLRCASLQRRFNRAELRAKATELLGGPARLEFIQAIQELLNSPCPNLEQRNHLRGLISTLR